jgi:hypothetical protein
MKRQHVEAWQARAAVTEREFERARGAAVRSLCALATLLRKDRAPLRRIYEAADRAMLDAGHVRFAAFTLAFQQAELARARAGKATG